MFDFLNRWHPVDVVVAGLTFILICVVAAAAFGRVEAHEDDATIIGSIVGVISVYVGLRLRDGGDDNEGSPPPPAIP